MQNPRQSHVEVFLDEGDKLSDMHHYTPAEVHEGTRRSRARYFQEQLIGNVNYPWMPEAHEMPAEAMSRVVVHQNCTYWS